LETVRLRVNGIEHTLGVAPERLLIQCLRDDLGLSGTKESCSVGVCGACAVRMNGVLVTACLTLAVCADGAEIETIEGVARDGALHPVQEAFVACGGLQCGFCTPGMVMSACALLDETEAPSREEIADWLMGNLCRCTGYYKILDSVAHAAALRSDRSETVRWRASRT
jgi:carbon-monoxide dehydrogenase small subunit